MTNSFFVTEPSHARDAELLERWRGGDEAAGRTLLGRCFVPLLRFFRTKASDVAEDLAQRTFVALLEQPERLREVSSFRAYVFGVARNQLLTYLRSRYREAQRFDPDRWSILALTGGVVGPALEEARRELVRRGMQALGVDDQVALELFYFEGLSVAEIADAQQASVSAVKMRLSRARERLRERLAELCDEAELIDSVNSDLERWIRALPAAMARSEQSEPRM